jgi:hypothetical protein
VIDDVFDDPQSITPAWMTEVLGRAGWDIPVSSLHYEPVGTGQMGRSYRFHLDHVGDAPHTLVVKLAGGEPRDRELVKRGFEKEIGFYRQFARNVEVRIPRSWHHGISEDLRSFTLVLDDLAPAVPGVQVDGCTVTQASDALRNLAGLHGPTWNDPSLFEHSSWLTPLDDARSAFLGDLLVMATEEFIRRFEEDLSSLDADTLRGSASRTAKWGTFVTVPYSLVHGDYRLDNLLFSPIGGGVFAVDWQTVTIGPPTRDLAYFMSTSLQVEDRRVHERELINEYHESLTRHGVADFDIDQCFDGYRLGMFQGPMITVLGCIYASAQRSEVADRMFLTMASRSCNALRDLDSFEIIDRFAG